MRQAAAFRLREGIENYTVYDVSDHLRLRGWQVPAYSFPPDLEDVHVIRIVGRNGFSRDLADAVLADLRRTTEFLESLELFSFDAHAPGQNAFASNAE